MRDRIGLLLALGLAAQWGCARTEPPSAGGAPPAGAPETEARPAASADLPPRDEAPRREPGELAQRPSSPELERLRREAAIGAMDTLPRLRLARALHDRGARLLAFTVTEHVAQERRPDFLQAFHHVFRGGPADLGEEAEAALLERAVAAPGDVGVLEELADLYLWRRDFRSAADTLEQAAELAPDDFSVHANLSQSLQALGETVRAGEVLEAWHEAHPDAPQTLVHRLQGRMGREPEAVRRELEAALRRHPDDASLHGLRASILEQAGRPAEAEAEMRRAAELSDDNPGFHLALAALEAPRNPSAAREHYLSAYFLDPRAGLDAPASSRIKELTFTLGTERFDLEGKNCSEPSCFRRLLADPNPVVVTLALRSSDLAWRDFHVSPVLGLLSHDDPDLRSKAVSVLRRHVDESFRPRLRELLGSKDPHVRGLSAFLAVRVLGPESIPVLEGFLESPAQAVRRDAMRAVASSGFDDSAEILAAHLAREPHPALQAEARSLLAQLGELSGPGG